MSVMANGRHGRTVGAVVVAVLGALVGLWTAVPQPAAVEAQSEVLFTPTPGPTPIPTIPPVATIPPLSVTIPTIPTIPAVPTIPGIPTIPPVSTLPAVTLSEDL